MITNKDFILDINNDLLHALLKLNTRTISKIAEDIGQHRVNLQAGLAGKRTLPIHVTNSLLELSGLIDGNPDTKRVHIWKVGVNKDPLKLVIPYFFPAGGEMGAVWRSKNYSIKKIIDPLVQFIRHRNTRVIIVYKPLIDGISPIDFPKLHWKYSPESEEKLVSVGERMDAWIDGNICVKEFDEVLGNEKSNWEQVIETSEKKGISPDDILDYIERILDNRQ
jgi:hypothetical protein